MQGVMFESFGFIGEGLFVQYFLFKVFCVYDFYFSVLMMLVMFKFSILVQFLLIVYVEYQSECFKYIVGVVMLVLVLVWCMLFGESECYCMLVLVGLLYDVGEFYIDLVYMCLGMLLGLLEWWYVVLYFVVGECVLCFMFGVGKEIVSVVLYYYEWLDGFGYLCGVQGVVLFVNGQILGVVEWLMVFIEISMMLMMCVSVVIKFIFGEFSCELIEVIVVIVFDDILLVVLVVDFMLLELVILCVIGIVQMLECF